MSRLLVDRDPVREYARRAVAAFTVPDADGLVLSCYLSQGSREGVRACLEKRRPRWQAR